MDKLKVIMVSVTVVLLLAVAALVFRFVQSTLIAATEALRQIGETPLETEQIEEEKWVAPDMPDESPIDIDAGMGLVDAEVAGEDQRGVDTGEDEDVQAVPVDETPDELAGTSPDDPLDTAPPTA